MAKPTGFKIGPLADKPPVAAPSATVAPPSEPVAPPAKPRLPPGTKSVTVYLPKDAWLQLRMLAGREDTTSHALLREAVDLLFDDRELTRCAVEQPADDAA